MVSSIKKSYPDKVELKLNSSLSCANPIIYPDGVSSNFNEEAENNHHSPLPSLQNDNDDRSNQSNEPHNLKNINKMIMLTMKRFLLLRTKVTGNPVWIN